MSLVTSPAVQLALPDDPLPTTRQCEKAVHATTSASDDKQTNEVPSRRCAVMLINAMPSNGPAHRPCAVGIRFSPRTPSRGSVQSGRYAFLRFLSAISLFALAYSFFASLLFSATSRGSRGRTNCGGHTRANRSRDLPEGNKLPWLDIRKLPLPTFCVIGGHDVRPHVGPGNISDHRPKSRTFGWHINSDALPVDPHFNSIHTREA